MRAGVGNLEDEVLTIVKSIVERSHRRDVYAKKHFRRADLHFVAMAREAHSGHAAADG